MDISSKIYITADELMNNSWRLAHAIRKSGWKPDILVVLWRGGAPVGIYLHEFLKRAGWETRHIPLKCSSYTGIGENNSNLSITLEKEVFSLIEPGAKVLVVDDVFDTGWTAKALTEKLAAIGAQSRFGCVYWKKANNQTTLKPDYFVEEKGSEWIVFPHEIDGLSEAETSEKSGLLASLLNDISDKIN